MCASCVQVVEVVCEIFIGKRIDYNYGAFMESKKGQYDKVGTIAMW